MIAGSYNMESVEVCIPPILNILVPSFSPSYESIPTSSLLLSSPFQSSIILFLLQTRQVKYFDRMEAAVPSIPVFSLDGERIWLHSFPDSMKVFASNSVQLAELGLSSLFSSLEGRCFARLPSSLSSRPFFFSFAFSFVFSFSFSSPTTLSYSTASYFYD